MFDLEQSIAKWRRQMSAGGVNNPEVLHELESHLREDIDAQMRSGVEPPQAFEGAVQRMGKAQMLSHEFAKARPHSVPAWPAASSKLAILVCIPLVALVAVIGLKAGLPPAEKLAATMAGAVLLIFICRHAIRHFGASLWGYPLNPDAAHTLELARQEASRYHHDFVGTEHLLLGLLEKGAVPGILRGLGVQSEAIRREVENLVGPGPEQQATSPPPFTPRAKRALRLASAEAKATRHSHVRPEHLFLGLLLEGAGVAALVLRNLGVDSQKMRAALAKANPNNH